MQALLERKQVLLEKWLERTLATYPSQTLRFLKGEKDRFRNPVGHTLREGLATLLDELTGEMDPAKIGPALESIVRLRAVQDFTPSQAVGFVYLLREIIDGEWAGDRDAAIVAVGGRSGGFTPPWRDKPAATPPWRGEPAATSGGSSAMHRRIDELALLAFDLFMKCREEIYEIKAREAQRKVYVLERICQRE